MAMSRYTSPSKRESQLEEVSNEASVSRSGANPNGMERSSNPAHPMAHRKEDNTERVRVHKAVPQV